jgi:nucleotidyltransferase/DNA polymerase involved in DNA repair
VMDFLHTHTKKQFYTALLQGLCRIGNRSVVCAASYEARELGVRSGSCQKASLASGPPIRTTGDLQEVLQGKLALDF